MRTITAHRTEAMPLNYLTEEEKKFQSEVRNFAESFVSPHIYEMDAAARLNKEVIRQVIDKGLMKIEIPLEYGGLGKPFIYSVFAIEEMAIIDPAVAVFIDVQNTLVVNAIMRWGTQQQKQKYLSMFANGTIGAFSITEKEAGSDATTMTCKAEKTDGGYIINGVKHWVTNAAEADIFIVFCKIVEPNSTKTSNEGRLTAFIVDKREAKGFTICEPEEKMGIRASSTCDTIYENVFVPEENILGSPGRGLMVALETLTDGRIGISAQMLGLAQGAFNAAVEYSEKRKQFGEYISTYQGIHFPIAQMATELHAARLLVYNTARMKMAKGDFKELMHHSSMAKLYASQVAERVVSQSLEIFGGKGYMKGNALEKLFRDAKIGTIYEGTSNIQLRTIARQYVKIK
ncbi:MAG: acyl-CoA dehydrogenase family protein [Bacillota bacterium]